MTTLRHRLLAVALVAVLSPMCATAQSLTGSLRDTNGQAVPVEQLRGHVTVLLFGGLVDPQSPEELPVLQRVAAKYAARGVEVYWVSLDPDTTSDAQLTGFAASNGFRGQVLRDPSGAVLRTVSGSRRPQLPTIVVLDSNAAMAGQPIGGFDRDADMVGQLSRIIDPALK